MARASARLVRQAARRGARGEGAICTNRCLGSRPLRKEVGRGARAWQAQIGGLTAGSCMRGWTGACVAVGGTAEELRLLVGCASAERAVACVGVWLESARGADVLGRRVPRVFGHVLILDTAVRDDLDLDLTFQSLHENTCRWSTRTLIIYSRSAVRATWLYHTRSNPEDAPYRNTVSTYRTTRTQTKKCTARYTCACVHAQELSTTCHTSTLCL